MKFAHLADLHLGKTVNGFSMIEDQKYILEQILHILEDKHVDAVLMAGDIYDRSVPSAEAMQLLNAFLSELNKRKYEVYIIAGNHDSAERLSYGSDIFNQMHIHIEGRWHGSLAYYDYHDAYGIVRVHLLPYIRPSDINRYSEEKADSYNKAIQMALETASLSDDRNIILTHQFISGTVIDEDGSEELNIGGLDAVDGHLFDDFDYAAMGHIHRPQRLLRETMRYSGTPLPYSFAESRYHKSMPVITMNEKGKDPLIELCPLEPLHGMREIHGYFNDILNNSRNDEHTDDYMHITLNDENDVTDALPQLREIYPNLMKMDYDNTRTRNQKDLRILKKMEKQNPMDIFSAFYSDSNGSQMSDEQKKIIQDLITSVWEGS